MKKNIKIIAIGITVLALVIGGFFGIRNTMFSSDKKAPEASFEATITKIGTSYIRVVNLDDPYSSSNAVASTSPDDSFDGIVLDISDSTVIESQGKTIKIDDLCVGDNVYVTYTGGIAETAPAQIHQVIKIELEKE